MPHGHVGAICRSAQQRSKYKHELRYIGVIPWSRSQYMQEGDQGLHLILRKPFHVTIIQTCYDKYWRFKITHEFESLAIEV